MHHAYYYEGSLSLLPALLVRAAELFKFEISNNPDVQMREFEKFGIDDAHELTRLASFKSVSNRALFVVGVGSITSEAQQALLKLFEEPQEGAVFVLLLPHGALLPTLRSRLLDFPETLEEKNPTITLAKKFLAASPKERSTSVTALLKEEEGAKERVRAFLQALEVELAKKIQDPKVRRGLEDIHKVRSYVGDRSPSLKMLLEHLVLSLPKL